MDKAVIFQVFDFVSFHICKTLLDKGFTVTGIHLPETEQMSEQEEKRLEIGRNANFSEQELSEWKVKTERTTTKQVVFLSIYDLFMLQQESFFQKEMAEREILGHIEQNPYAMDVVLLFPMQMLRANENHGFADFLNQVNQLPNKSQIVYLPTIYGPWQPPVFLFHQKIISAKQHFNLSISDREWTEDAIYVEDAVESIIEVVETKKSGSYLLESGENNYWDLCADYLKIDLNKPERKKSEPLKTDKQLIRMPVKNITSLADSFKKQIDLTERLYGKKIL